MQKGIGSSLYLHIHKPKNLPRTQSGKDFLVYGCANTSLNKLPFALATTSIQTHSHLQSCYPANKEAQYFFCLWLCKRKLEQIPFCTCHNPNPKTRSSSQLLPTNKECASTPPEAELHKLCFAQCTYSARTVHGTVHGHKTLQIPWDWRFVDNLQKTIKIFSFLCFLITFGKIRGIYSVLWPCTVTCTACTVRALCKTRCLCPLIFSSAERCNSASGGVQAQSTLVHHARHTALISNFCPHAEQMLQCCFFVCE